MINAQFEESQKIIQGSTISNFRGNLLYGNVKPIEDNPDLDTLVLIIDTSITNRNYCFAQEVVKPRSGIVFAGNFGIVRDEAIRERLKEKLLKSEKRESYALNESFIHNLDEIDNLHSKVAHSYNAQISQFVARLISSARSSYNSA